ncbi:MAG: hypothetical protein IIX84_02585 [Oscillospiraceae bacterium]|nr:hypothetical protein [Oscillospiraceae bacterium]
MSVIVSGISLPLGEDKNIAIKNAAKLCGVFARGEITAEIYKESVDARRGKISTVYSVKISGMDPKYEQKLCEKNQKIRLCTDVTLDDIVSSGKVAAEGLERPVVVGLGPAGMFAALTLAKMGLNPVVIERGKPIESRDGDVSDFIRNRKLNPSSNIQFGEGGAGAYSDGKLTTRISDPLCSAVLKELVSHGAPAETLTKAHPHIGTDVLKGVVSSIDRETERLGGSILYETCVTGFEQSNGRVTAVKTDRGVIPCSAVILAVGHSARDTFENLLNDGLEIIPKSFAVGLRIEHLQEDINNTMYGRFAGSSELGAAEYFVSNREGDRGCFSFCMCPGGVVCAAASQSGGVVTNGMSYHARNGKNGNAAIAVSADLSSFPEGPLGGAELSRILEERAFIMGGEDYTAPAQLVSDFIAGRPSIRQGRIAPTYPLGVKFGSVESLLPPGGTELMRRSLSKFASSYRFFGDGDAVLTGPETRTSSPVRMLRLQNGVSSKISGVFPCGEGAGYAGGIMSAAVDGIRQALNLANEVY